MDWEEKGQVWKPQPQVSRGGKRINIPYPFKQKRAFVRTMCRDLKFKHNI